MLKGIQYHMQGTYNYLLNKMQSPNFEGHMYSGKRTMDM